MALVESDLHTKGATLFIPELDEEVVFGKEPLRHEGTPTIYDLLGVAVRNGISPIVAAGVVARQLYLYKNPTNPDGVFSRKKDLKGLMSEIPFLVSQTSLAIFKYGIWDNINALDFTRNRSSYQPSESELAVFGFNATDVENVRKNPAKLAGCVGIFHWDGIDENEAVVMRRSHGFYEGKWNIPGGHYDSPLDVGGLAELIEEVGLSKDLLKRRDVRPLGVIDQVIFKKSPAGEVSLDRFLNLVWTVNASFDNIFLNACWEGGCRIDVEGTPQEDLTPIAAATFRMAGYL